MRTSTKSALEQLELYWRKTSTIQNGSYLFLAILRSAIDLRQLQSPRIQQGLEVILKDILKINPRDLLKGMRNASMMSRYGIIRPKEHPLQVMTVLTNAINTLGKPVTRRAIMNNALDQDRQNAERALNERIQRQKRRKRLSEQKDRDEKKKAIRLLQEQYEALQRINYEPPDEDPDYTDRLIR